MNDILDDFVDSEVWESPSTYYSVYALFLVLLMAVVGYLNSHEILEVTPVFGTYPGQLVCVTFLVSTIYCCKKATKLLWMPATVLGTVILVICFTIALQSVIAYTGIMLPTRTIVWATIAILYVILSIGIIHSIRYWRQKQAT